MRKSAGKGERAQTFVVLRDNEGGISRGERIPPDAAAMLFRKTPRIVVAARTQRRGGRRFVVMSSESEPEKPVERRHGNKATMDQPQEEFVADQSVPSHSAMDREHGDEVPQAKEADEEAAPAD